MKHSNYNTVIKLGNGWHLLYNAFTDKFIAVQNCDDVDFTQPPDVTKSTRPKMYEDLVEIGYYVDDDIDEVERLRERIEQIDNDDSFFHLQINPTLNCNFNCWYCYEEHRRGSIMSEEVMRRVLFLVENRLKNAHVKNMILGFFGGEPLLYFEKVAKPLIVKISERSKEAGIRFSTHFTTNAYLLTDEKISFLKDYNAGFQITLDGNREEHNKVRYSKDKGGSYDTIITNIKKLLSNGCDVILRINYTKDNIEGVTAIGDDLKDITEEKKRHLSIDFQRVWQDYESETVDDILRRVEKVEDTFKKLGLKISDKTPDYVRDSCYGNKRNHALVNFNGDVYNCTARDFTPQNRSGILTEEGGIIWENDSMERRMGIRLRRSACIRCNIAPLCGGGCSQKCLENEDDGDFCLYGNSDERKKYIVLQRFEGHIVRKKRILSTNTNIVNQ